MTRRVWGAELTVYGKFVGAENLMYQISLVANSAGVQTRKED